MCPVIKFCGTSHVGYVMLFGVKPCRYEQYGCSKAAVDEALHVVDNMVDAYRLAHGIRDFL